MKNWKRTRNLMSKQPIVDVKRMSVDSPEGSAVIT